MNNADYQFNCENNQTWTRIDIFCLEEQLGTIISNYIRPFIETIDRKLDYYFLTVNNSNRPHLGLHLLCDSESIKLLQLLAEYFKKNKIFQLSSKNSVKVEITHNVAQLFLSNPIANPINFYFAKELTQLLFEIADKDMMEREKILELSLHIHLCLIKNRAMIDETNLKTLLLQGYCITVNDGQDSKEVLNFMSDLYEENKEQLAVIFDSIMNFDNYKSQSLPSWFDKWFNHCLLKSAQNKANYPANPVVLDIVNYMIPNFINMQLGLSKDLIFLQCYLINRIINTPYDLEGIS
ncbi:hypothetical protein ACXZ1K_09620 [Pedobacter sp. PWIIR3]